jgi:hypothetical protein
VNLMKTVACQLPLAAFVMIAASQMAFASPLKLRPIAPASVGTCACSGCQASTALGDAEGYHVELEAETLLIKTGMVGFYVHLADASGQPMTDARVTILLSRPEAKHPETLMATGGKKGVYAVVTALLPGTGRQWRADVQMVTAGGNRATRAFTFIW